MSFSGEGPFVPFSGEGLFVPFSGEGLFVPFSGELPGEVRIGRRWAACLRLPPLSRCWRAQAGAFLGRCVGCMGGVEAGGQLDVATGM